MTPQNETPTGKDSFVDWGKEYVKDKAENPSKSWAQIKSAIITTLISLGVSEQLLKEIFDDNPTEVLETLLGEIISAFALIFAWKKEDKEAFSQALGQIGVGTIFALNPLTALIALAGLAIGFNKLIHPESVKKGGLLSLVGISVTALFPGGFVLSFLAAVGAVIIVNKHINIDRPIEVQIKEIYRKMRTTPKQTVQKNCRKVWDIFESSINQVASKINNPRTKP